MFLKFALSCVIMKLLFNYSWFICKRLFESGCVCLWRKLLNQKSCVYTCCWWCCLCLKFLVVGRCINFSCCSIKSSWWFIDCIFSSVGSSCQWWWNCAGLKFLDLFSSGGNCAGICSSLVSCWRIFKFSCFSLWGNFKSKFVTEHN